MRTGGVTARVRIALAALAAICVGNTLWVGFGPLSGPAASAETALVAVVQVAAGVLCLVRGVTSGRPGRGWVVLGAGLLSWDLGAGLLMVLDLNSATALTPPTLADPFYLAFYPCAYLAIMLLVRAEARTFLPSSWLDGLVAGLGLAAVCAAALTTSVAKIAGGRPLAAVVTLAYPASDLVLLFLLTMMVVLVPLSSVRRWGLLAGGFLLFITADGGYVFASAHGAWVSGTLPAAAWPAGMVLMSAAAWQSRRPAGVRLDTTVTLAVPLVGAGSALAVLIGASQRHLNPLAVTLAGAGLLVFGVRMLLSFRELRELAGTRQQARTDELTGLGNRRLLMQQLAGRCAPAGADAEPLALLLVDLDRFKEVNDSLGHGVGDQLLRLVGPRLAAALRSSDLLVRLGGDEFAVLLQGADAGYADNVARRLVAELAAPFALEVASLHIGASVGIALWPGHAADADGLMRCADVAMYHAKRTRTGYSFYDPDHDSHRERLTLAEDLRAAIARDEVVLHYQPQVSLDDGAVHCLEALARWEHPALGAVRPDVFIPLAEETGLMRQLTARVLERAAGQCASWRRTGWPVAVAVNLSVTNLMDAQLVEQVRQVLDDQQLPPEALVLEITESTLMADPHRAQEVTARLRALGVGVSIDDFGTGYSSLAYLRSLPVDELKLDRVFVGGLAREGWERERDAAIVAAAITLAHALGLRVVAEGVEDEATLDALRALGCDHAQGYHLGRPAPPARARPAARTSAEGAGP